MMFESRQVSSPSNNQSMCFLASSNDSFNSSFCSNSSWDSFDRPTPSTRRSSLDPVELEDALFSSASSSERYGSSSSIASISSITDNRLSAFPDHTMIFSIDNGNMVNDQTVRSCNSFSSYSSPTYDTCESNNSLRINTPSLGDAYSPTSGMASSPAAMNFIVPSQTFIDIYDLNSPTRPMKSLHFGSPISNYGTDISMIPSPTCFMFSYGDPRSALTTPSRSVPVRQPIFEPLQSSAPLHQVQGKSQAVKHTRKRMKREYVLGGNIRVQHRAEKECPWDGCNRRFRRQEHLKRHEKIHTSCEEFPCQFCERKFSRSDNLKSHIWLHANPKKKSARTTHRPEAMQVWLSMDRKSRKSKDAAVKMAIKMEENRSRSRVSRL